MYLVDACQHATLGAGCVADRMSAMQLQLTMSPPVGCCRYQTAVLKAEWLRCTLRSNPTSRMAAAELTGLVCMQGPRAVQFAAQHLASQLGGYPAAAPGAPRHPLAAAFFAVAWCSSAQQASQILEHALVICSAAISP